LVGAHATTFLSVDRRSTNRGREDDRDRRARAADRAHGARSDTKCSPWEDDSVAAGGGARAHELARRLR
jgi:hypothetical protein